MTYGKLSLTDTTVKQALAGPRRRGLPGSLVTTAAAAPPQGLAGTAMRPARLDHVHLVAIFMESLGFQSG
jgi:hypothetical protein